MYRDACAQPLAFTLAVMLNCVCLMSCQSSLFDAAHSHQSTQARQDSRSNGLHSALHNVQPLNDRVISGAVPKGDAAFDQLQAMGVMTIISVDGATPDVERAAARGIRYVHIPISYSHITYEQQLRIARAVRDLPGPVFIHCHHGLHRSPAAVAAVGVALGMISPDEGLAYMTHAGTAAHYQGLYACVHNAAMLSSSEIDAVPDDFPEVHKPQGIIALMVEIDLVFEHLGDIRTAGWATPDDHPDLVPAAEAGRLADLLRLSGEDPRSTALGEDYMQQLAEAAALAATLEQAIVQNASHEELNLAFNAVNTSCRDCHRNYRDRPPSRRLITQPSPADQPTRTAHRRSG